MIILSCKQPEELIDNSLKWLRETIEVHGITKIFIPAGASPLALYEHLERNPQEFLRDTELIQVDDITSGSKQGLFQQYFRKHLPSYLEQLHFIDEGEIQAEAAILGIGMNGHIAFHEPHLPPDFAFGEVVLSPQTCLNLQLEPATLAITHGLGNFMKCRRIMLLVNGPHKRAVLQNVLAGDPNLPASRFLHHPDLTILASHSSLERPEFS